MSELTLKDKAMMANMTETELDSLHITLGRYIREKFGLWAGNISLMNSCRFVAKKQDVNEDAAAGIIIRELWKKLKESHKLRIVK